MTDVKKLAEKIVNEIYSFEHDDGAWAQECIIPLLVEALDEVVAERGKLFQENVAKFPQELKEAKADAYEQAVKAVDDVWQKNNNCDPEAGLMMEQAINAIRALGKGEREKKPHVCNCEFCGSPETVVLGETAKEKCQRLKQCGPTTTDPDCRFHNPQPEKCDHRNCTHGGVIRPSDSETAVEAKIKEGVEIMKYLDDYFGKLARGGSKA